MPKPRLDYDPKLSGQQDRFAAIPEMVAQRELVRAALALQPGERVLEIGCGNGSLAAEMACEVGESGTVVGVDSSDAMVGIAQALRERAGRRNMRIVAADATDLRFPSASFDAAAVVQCFCLVADVEAAIAGLFRVLRPGGRAIVLDTDWDTLAWHSNDPLLMDRVVAAYKDGYADARLPRRLPRLLSDAGFRLASSKEFAIVNKLHHPESFSAHHVGFTRAVVEGTVPAADLDAWAAGIAATIQNGSYSFRLVRSVFEVEKPTPDERREAAKTGER